VGDYECTRQSSPGFPILWGKSFRFRMTPERRKTVLADLNHRSKLTANDAARAVAKDNDTALLPGLVRTLRHGRRTHNRVEAAYALGFMTGVEGTSALESALSNRSENTRVRAFAAETLAHRHRRRSHAVLLQNLQDPPREVRFWCAFALGQMRERKALVALSRLAKSDHRVLRGWWAVSKEAKDAIAEIKHGTRWGSRRCAFCPYRE
jgi:HEAT repeat protein